MTERQRTRHPHNGPIVLRDYLTEHQPGRSRSGECKRERDPLEAGEDKDLPVEKGLVAPGPRSNGRAFVCRIASRIGRSDLA